MLEKFEAIISYNVAPYAITSAAIVLLLAAILAFSQRKRAKHVRSATFSEQDYDEYLEDMEYSQDDDFASLVRDENVSPRNCLR